jgi:hypothetical protein
MAIKAVISTGEPDALSADSIVWSGALAADGDDGVGLTTAAILGFFSEASPGTWYRLEEFSRQVASINWEERGEGQWTSLEIKQDGPRGSSAVLVDIKLEDAVKSLCLSAVDHLATFESKNIWVRFE